MQNRKKMSKSDTILTTHYTTQVLRTINELFLIVDKRHLCDKAFCLVTKTVLLLNNCRSDLLTPTAYKNNSVTACCQHKMYMMAEM